jgi:hypothetical protein
MFCTTVSAVASTSTKTILIDDFGDSKCELITRPLPETPEVRQMHDDDMLHECLPKRYLVPKIWERENHGADMEKEGCKKRDEDGVGLRRSWWVESRDDIQSNVYTISNYIRHRRPPASARRPRLPDSPVAGNPVIFPESDGVPFCRRHWRGTGFLPVGDDP